MGRPDATPAATTATLAGRALGRAASVGARLRPAPKPLHPRGTVLAGRLERTGAGLSTGVPWLDEPGTERVLVRLSRSLGLPGPLPDVLGLALRVPRADGGDGDLLLATTGSGPVGRFLLRPAREVTRGRLSTLMPYRSPSGPVLVAASVRQVHPALSVRLEVARPRGPWRAFGTLSAGDPADAQDAPVSFDPVLNPLPGLEPYRWVGRVREPAYRAARRARGAGRPGRS